MAVHSLSVIHAHIHMFFYAMHTCLHAKVPRYMQRCTVTCMYMLMRSSKHRVSSCCPLPHAYVPDYLHVSILGDIGATQHHIKPPAVLRVAALHIAREIRSLTHGSLNAAQKIARDVAAGSSVSGQAEGRDDEYDSLGFRSLEALEAELRQTQQARLEMEESAALEAKAPAVRLSMGLRLGEQAQGGESDMDARASALSDFGKLHHARMP